MQQTTSLIRRDATPHVRDSSDGGPYVLTARAAPLGQDTEIAPGIRERIEPGAITVRDGGASLRYLHDQPIGRIRSVWETETDLMIEAEISRTPLGETVHQLAADGVLRLSVGMMVTDSETVEGVWVIRAAQLAEVSLVDIPAYTDTEIVELRSTERIQPVTDHTDAAAAAQIEDAIADMRRQLADVSASITTAEPTHPLAEYRSLGDFAQRAPEGLRLPELDTRAPDTTTATGPTAPAWLGRIQSRMAAKQRLTGAYAHTRDLPSTGMSVTYSREASSTVAVRETAEGAAVPLGTIQDELATAEIKTYAGGTELSRQVVDRADPGYLSSVLERQAVAYAARIEAVTVATHQQAVLDRATTVSVGSGTTKLSEMTADDLRDIVIDAARIMDDSLTHSPDMIVLTWDQLKIIARIAEDRRALRWSGADAAVHNSGSIDPVALAASIFGLPVVPIPGQAGAAIVSRSAIAIREAPGAPTRLQEDSVLTLSRPIAVYGYAAHYVQAPAGIVPIIVAPEA